MKFFLYVFIFLCILFGIYKMFTDDDKWVGRAAFIFAVLVFLLTLIPTADTSEQSKTQGDTPIELESDIEETSQNDVENSINVDDNKDNNEDDYNESENKVIKILDGSFSGSIVNDNQEDCYEYTPSISGVYRFDFDTNDANTDYKFYVYSSTGKQIASACYSNGGETVELAAGEKYSIVIQQYRGTPQYAIAIGEPRGAYSIDGTDIEGTLSYTDQEDEYTYTAPITGQYRFDFSSSDVQCNYRFYIYASNNEQLASTSYSNEGKTVELIAGETYTIVVKQYVGYLSYKITIGLPKEIQVINGNSFSGSILYRDQLDRYTYVAPVTGRYRFEFGSDNAQCNYRFYMYASDNEQLASTYYSSDGKTVDLVSGEEYRIEIKQYVGYENYTINIGIPNTIGNVEGNIISGAISYIDQENIYTYVAPTSGKYSFSFGISDVNANYRFYVISPINEQLVSTYYSNKSKTVQLDEGQVYTIKVKQYSGFPEYRIDINVQ